MEKLSFSLEDEPNILDIIEKVQAAFLVNSEKITKDFYAGFKKEHSNFAKFITGIDDHITERKIKQTMVCIGYAKPTNVLLFHSEKRFLRWRYRLFTQQIRMDTPTRRRK